jgi:hypothetical protein
MNLKQAHYEAMKTVNPAISDEEIEEDWKLLCEELNLFLDDIKPTVEDVPANLPF